MRMMPLMRALDTDADGTIDRAEIEAASTALATLDSDQDGKLTFAELRPSMPQRDRGFMPPPPPPRPDERDDDRPRDSRDGQNRRGDQADGGPRGGPQRMIAAVMNRDADGDGKISRDEAGQRMAQRFDRIDADDDDFVTEEELKTAFSRRPRD